MKMTVAKAIVKCLEIEDIKIAFGIIGSHYLSLFKEIKDSNIKYISVKHEAAAGYMALSYTRTAQQPSLILGTAGPGAANLVGSVAEMFKAGIPGIIITPTVASTLFGKKALQEDSGLGTSYSITSLMGNITKQSILAFRHDQIPQYLRDLIRCSLTAPFGPVHLCVPCDFFDMELEFDEIEPFNYRTIEDERMESKKLCLVAEELRNAQNPLLLIGNRCVFPDCSVQIQAICDHWNIPFILTHASKGLLNERQDLFGGVLDYFGHKSAERYVKQCDCIFAIGLDFSEAETLAYDPELFKNSKLFILDSDSSQFTSSYKFAQSISGSIKHSLAFLLEHMHTIVKKDLMNLADYRDKMRSMNEYQFSEMATESDPMKIEYIISNLSRIMPEKSAVYSDMGASTFSFIRHYATNKQGFHALSGNYSMGQAVAGCIGGKLSNPDKFVVAISGDGAFLMHSNEILTAVQYGLGITWIVFVEDLYNMIQINQCLAYGGGLEFCTRINNPNFQKLAEAYGIHYYEIKTKEDIESSIKKAYEKNRQNESVLITVTYAFEQHLPIKPQLVRSMKNMGQTKDIQSNPYLMKAFSKALKEKG